MSRPRISPTRVSAHEILGWSFSFGKRIEEEWPGRKHTTWKLGPFTLLHVTTEVPSESWQLKIADRVALRYDPVLD